MTTECPREPEVIDAITSGRWPARAEPGLCEHVAQCALCADVAEVAGALHADQQAAWTEAPIPSAEIVWYRAQMRARAEAARLASRPMVLVQAIGVACAVGVVAAVFGTFTLWMRSWADWISSAATLATTVAVAGSGGFDVISLAVRGAVLAAGVWLVLAPVAVYLAATDD